MERKVRDVMTPEPIGVYYDQTIADAARVMRDAGVGAVLVVNARALAGVITDRDIVVRAVAESVPPDAPVGPLCSPDLIGVNADDDTGEAVRLMRQHALRRLPVVDNGQVAGMVSLGDLAIVLDERSALAHVSKAAANSLQVQIVSGAQVPSATAGVVGGHYGCTRRLRRRCAAVCPPALHGRVANDGKPRRR